MNKNLFIFYFLFSFLIHGQNRNSVLNEGKWYKFSVNKTGVYKLDAVFLKKLGINIKSVNPKNIQIFGNGGKMLPEKISKFRYKSLQENAIQVVGKEDSKFNNNDYILFYAKGPHHWDFNNKNIKHNQNIYSNKAYYFITIGKTSGKRIQQANSISEEAKKIIKTYDDYLFYEKENTNLLALGRLWFGEDFSISNTKNINIPFENAAPEKPIKIKITGVAQSVLTSSLKVIVNNKNLGFLNFPPVSRSSISGLARYVTLTKTVNASNSLNFRLSYNNGGNPAAKAFLDYIEVIGAKKLIAKGKQFGFRNINVSELNETVEYQIENKKNINQIWDVTNPISPQKIISNQTKKPYFSFKSQGGTLKEYVVINSKNFYSPQVIEKSVVNNQNLHSISNIDYLIITNKQLLNEANRLANYHKKNNNLNTKVVKISEIYNEFSSGSPDIVSIRDFIKHIYDNSTKRKLKYVCFFGDSSYDFKNRISGNNNIVPSYHAKESFNLVNSYVTDDFYVMIKDNDGQMNAASKIDIASGRIPVSTVEQARKVVDKILSYYDSNSFGSWKNGITLVADDIDQNADKSIQPRLEEIADKIKIHKPELNLTKIYADAFKQETSSAGDRYPQVKQAITRNIEKGTLVFNYFGHGGEDGLASERLLDIPQIKTLSNKSKLPLFITVTCEFSRFDNPLRDTAGEKLFRNPKGGAAAMITTTRDIYISVGEQFNKKLVKHVLNFKNNDDNSSIAENLMKTKNETNSTQRFFIYFFGDPAMKLAIPKPNIQILRLNNKKINQASDTLKALSKIVLEGAITDLSNTILTNFNGKIESTVFDKPIDKKTLDNDNFGQTEIFDTQESKLFKGTSSVKNGKFKIEFIVPKDIKTTYGKGKISMYANNQKIEKNGANLNIIIGGINPNAPKDNQGPKINAFLNDKTFVNGGQTNESPNLIIELEDPSGINTSLTAVDHDIIAILDNNDAEPIILNDYYQTELDNFTKGKVKYQFKKLNKGKHTLKIKAWDTYNNSSNVSFSFEVLDDSKLYLNNILNYPNPFVNYTEFWFEHNKPNSPLNVQIQIFTISGKLIKSIQKQVQTNGTLSRSITWNGTDDFGNQIAKGVYVYKLKVKTNTNLISEKYEKLVKL